MMRLTLGEGYCNTTPFAVRLMSLSQHTTLSTLSIPLIHARSEKGTGRPAVSAPRRRDSLRSSAWQSTGLE